MKVPWKRIIKYLQNSKDEMDPALSEWINEDEQHAKILAETKALSVLTQDQPKEFSPDLSKAWQSIDNRTKNAKTANLYLPIFIKSAAAIILLMVGFSLSLFLTWGNGDKLARIVSPAGNKTHVYLPDSSFVILNGGTSLAYAEDFLSNRSVELHGEAVFDVRKSKENSFVVSTEKLDVEVLGTIFNVKAYAEDNDIEISLKEGIVALIQKGQKAIELNPGEIATVDKATGKIRRYKGNVERVMSWSNNELIFENKTFAEIVSYLERWYGVEIEISEELAEQHRYTFRVKTESLKELLDLINVITPISYEINGKQVWIAKIK
jgi:transmembrane sensor